jgi:hypothetical protein
VDYLQRLDWRVLLSGHFPEYAYDLGSLDTSLPFAKLKALSLINDKAHAADQDPDFSARIRAGRRALRSVSVPDPPRALPCPSTDRRDRRRLPDPVG